ncbi:MAG: type 1 glutamine amidotransferase domain-containing protein [Parachlamydiales bacterium]
MKKILCFVDEVYEDLELWYPKIRLEEAGFAVVVAGPEKGHLYKGKHGYPCHSDAAIREMKSADFVALVIPGGFAPDKLRRDPKVLELTAAFDREGKPIASICHGGWIPISAKIVKGRRVTSTRAIKDDLENAGATWVDEAVVVDRNLVTSRTPKDLADFLKALLQKLG